MLGQPSGMRAQQKKQWRQLMLLSIESVSTDSPPPQPKVFLCLLSWGGWNLFIYFGGFQVLWLTLSPGKVFLGGPLVIADFSVSLSLQHAICALCFYISRPMSLPGGCRSRLWEAKRKYQYLPLLHPCWYFSFYLAFLPQPPQ